MEERRQVDDDVDARHRRGHRLGPGEIAVGELDLGHPVRPALGLMAETVQMDEGTDGHARGQQGSHRGGTDRAGGACDQGSHGGR
jgi:hypothetical protein